MKHRSRTTTTPLRDIFNQVEALSSEFVQKNLTWKVMEPLLYYHRNNFLPPIPKTLEEAIKLIAFNEHPFKEYFQGYVTLGEEVAIFLVIKH